MENELEKEPIITTLNVDTGLTLDFGNCERVFNAEELFEFSDFLEKKAEFLSELQSFAGHVDNFSEEEFRKNKLEALADHEDEDEEFSFSTGWQCFYFFPEKGNNDGSHILVEEFTKFYGENCIEADPEYSWSYFYSKDIEDIVAFEKFVIEQYAIPFLKEYR
jgi:hypothetical protein